MDNLSWDIFNEIQNCNNEVDIKVNSKIDIKIESKLNKPIERYNDNKCNYCGELSLITDNEICVCKICGRESSIIIDNTCEWRYYGANDNKRNSDPTRCGFVSNELLFGSMLGSVIGGKGFELFRRMQKWNSMSEHRDRTLMKIYNNINNNIVDTDITMCIADRAKVMYKLLSNEQLKRGDSREAIITACLFYSCKDKDISKSIKELSDIVNLKVKKISTGCKQFSEMMYAKNKKYIKNMRPSTAKDFITIYGKKLNLNIKYYDICLYISYMANKFGIVLENTPTSISVGCIYLLSEEYNLGLNKKLISDKCNVSEVTISKIYKNLKIYRTFLIPNEKRLNLFKNLLKNSDYY